MGEGSGLSVADALALQDSKKGEGNMFGGNGFLIVFFLFFLLVMGGGSMFGGNMGGINNPAMQGALTRSDLCEGFNFNNVQRNTEDIKGGICDGFYAMNNSMKEGFYGLENSLCNGFHSVNDSVNQLGHHVQNCCCETNRNIDALRFENAKNTSEIIQNNERGVQRIVDTLTQNTIDDLRDKLYTARNSLDTCRLENSLVERLDPCPKPAYFAGYNYGGYPNQLGYGYNCDCGKTFC